MKGNSCVMHYRTALDHLEVDDVRFSTYDDRRLVHPFDEIYKYYGWVVCGKHRVYRHLPERVKRQYGFVQDIPIHPSDVLTISVDQVLQAFKDFRTCCIPLEK
jgi:hypothetical protein